MSVGQYLFLRTDIYLCASVGARSRLFPLKAHPNLPLSCFTLNIALTRISPTRRREVPT
jgi:hypothetical protein